MLVITRVISNNYGTPQRLHSLAKMMRDCENDQPSEHMFNKHNSFELSMALLFTLCVGLHMAVYREACFYREARECDIRML